MSAADHNVRHQLLELGIGDFNATLIIPTMFYGPAQSDPGLTPVKVLVRALQRMMREMGATWVVSSGELDAGSATCLKAIAGPMWAEMPWYELSQKLIDARKAGKRFEPMGAARGVVLSGFQDGVVTSIGSVVGAAIGGIIVYHILSKKKKGR